MKNIPIKKLLAAVAILLVFGAVRLPLERGIFAQLEDLCPEDALFAARFFKAQQANQLVTTWRNNKFVGRCNELVLLGIRDL